MDRLEVPKPGDIYYIDPYVDFGLPIYFSSENGNFQGQVGKIYTQQEILTDALWIEVSQPFHEKNCYMYRVYNEDTTNMPEGVIAGVRQPGYIFDKWNACVIIVEVYPTYGRIWINHYDGTQWNGWANIVN